MEQPVPMEAPPPYSPPNEPEAEPPPYSPPDAEKQPHPHGYSETQSTTYGSVPGGNQAKHPETSPAGTLPYIPPEMHPVSSSSTLLIAEERKPPTFILLSIMTCLCFSPLFGIIAIIFSCLSDAAWSARDFNSARRYSQVALILSITGIALTVLTLVLLFITGAFRVH